MNKNETIENLEAKTIDPLEIYTVEQAAHFSGNTLMGVYKAIQYGKLKTRQLHREHIILGHELIRYCRARKPRINRIKEKAEAKTE